MLAVSPVRAEDIGADPSNYKKLAAVLKPGDTLHLAAGRYPLLSLSGLSGTANAWVTIQGPATGPPAVISVNPADPRCCNLVQLRDVAYVALKNLRIDSALADAVDGVNAQGISHDVLIENCTLVGQGSRQETVGIATRGPAWNWVIRGNTILGAGTGLYLGGSAGDSPFINGIIEDNLIADTIGYNAQIKWQAPYSPPAGLSAGPHRTIIRNNVFIKSKPRSAWPPDRSVGARPNLLVGGFPDAGFGSGDRYEIYGNLFYENRDGESLFQGSGVVYLHDNIFVGGSYRAVSLVDHDLPIRRAYVYHNTIYGRVSGVTLYGSALEDSIVAGNLILANRGIRAPVQRDNIVDTPEHAASYVVSPSLVLGSMDFYPRHGRATGRPLDMSPFSSNVGYDVDFNGTSKGTFTFRGAYAGEGSNPGWRLTAGRKQAAPGGRGRPGVLAAPGVTRALQAPRNRSRRTSRSRSDEVGLGGGQASRRHRRFSDVGGRGFGAGAGGGAWPRRPSSPPSCVPAAKERTFPSQRRRARPRAIGYAIVAWTRGLR
jgi:hypothetical protein